MIRLPMARLPDPYRLWPNTMFWAFKISGTESQDSCYEKSPDKYEFKKGGIKFLSGNSEESGQPGASFYL